MAILKATMLHQDETQTVLEVRVDEGYTLVIHPEHGQLVPKEGTTPPPAREINDYLDIRAVVLYQNFLGMQRINYFFAPSIMVNKREIYLFEGEIERRIEPMNLVIAVIDESRQNKIVTIRYPDIAMDALIRYSMAQAEVSIPQPPIETARSYLEEQLPDFLRQMDIPVKRRSRMEIRLPLILNPLEACMEFVVAYQF